MADTVQVKWLYPPDFENLSLDLRQGHKSYCVQLTGLSDGTGETDIKKVLLSDLRMPGGNDVTRTTIKKIKYNVVGEMVTLEWNRVPNIVIAYLENEGCVDWSKEGGNVDSGESGDGTGDIILTTTSHDSGDHYDITIWFEGKEDKNEQLDF